MGFIDITTAGSFPSRKRQFVAMKHGHAHAVAEALQWLTEEVLPAAIEQDHQLHERGVKPSAGFGRPKSRRDG